MKAEPITCDLMIIGGGLAGAGAALFAANRGISTVFAGSSNAMAFYSGLFDLMAVHPVAEGRYWENPWEAIDRVRSDLPNHPYARVPSEDLRNAWQEIEAFLSAANLPYHSLAERNRRIMTSMGTIRPLYAAPAGMNGGIASLMEKKPGLIVDIEGLRGFSARQIRESLKNNWPDLRTATIQLPDGRRNLFPEAVARSFENENARQAILRHLKAQVGKARSVGFPAVLGIENSDAVLADLEEELGLPVYEIPTMPPSIPGIRLRNAFEKHLPALVVRRITEQVLHVSRADAEGFVFHAGHPDKKTIIHSRGAVLASGRFFSKGLKAARTHIHETVFDLPVFQPSSRSHWHAADFLTPEGHGIHRAGIETDECFRPLDARNEPVHKKLFAAGSVLAHQDWTRMKCGAGLSIATAYMAVKAFWEMTVGAGKGCT